MQGRKVGDGCGERCARCDELLHDFGEAFMDVTPQALPAAFPTN